MKKQFETKTLICFFSGFLIIGALIHEAGHLACNNLLGGAGMIYYEHVWDTNHLMWLTLPKNNAWLVFLSGGLAAALFFFVFFWLPAHIEQNDLLKKIAVFHVLAHLFSALIETQLYLKEIKLYQWPLLAAYILTGTLFLIITIRQKKGGNFENPV